MFMTLAGCHPETFIRLFADFLEYGDGDMRNALKQKHSNEYACQILASAESSFSTGHRITFGDTVVVFSSDWTSVDVDGDIDSEILKEIILEGARQKAMINDQTSVTPTS